MKSDHRDLLNDLVDMQASMLYRARRDVLSRAENVIVRQELRIKLLEQQIVEQTAGILEIREALCGVHAGLQTAHQNLAGT